MPFRLLLFVFAIITPVAITASPMLPQIIKAGPGFFVVTALSLLVIYLLSGSIELSIMVLIPTLAVVWSLPADNGNLLTFRHLIAFSILVLLFIGYTRLCFSRRYYRFLPGPVPYLLLGITGFTALFHAFGLSKTEILRGIDFHVPMITLVTLSGIPILAALLLHHRIDKGKAPRTLGTMINSLKAYFLFILGCLVLTLSGFILFALLPGKKKIDQRKMMFHQMIRQFCRFLIFATIRRHRIINPAAEDFSRPSIIIANHQSFIDLIVLLSLSPRLILLTNDWVWNSPLFGRIVKWADYYPVSSGIEKSLDSLRSKMDQGFSIVVFPEGTRSRTGRIKRFKKGAFYLAEQFGLDLLPVFLHGTGLGITKGEFLLKKTMLTTFISNRISPDDARFSGSYSLRTKKVTAWFRGRYHQFEKSCQVPELLKNRLKHYYAYRGLKVQHDINKLFAGKPSLHNLAVDLNQLPCSRLRGISCHSGLDPESRKYSVWIPDQVRDDGRLKRRDIRLNSNNKSSHILHLGCRTGELSHLLSLQLVGCRVTGVDSNRSDVRTAKDVSRLSQNLDFLETTDFQPAAYDYDTCLINFNRLFPRTSGENRCYSRLKPRVFRETPLFEADNNDLQTVLDRLPGSGHLITYNIDREDRQEISFLLKLMNRADIRSRWQQKNSDSNSSSILIFKKSHE